MESPTAILLYHFFHPDDVISARLFSDLGRRLAESGYRVVAMPAARSCHDHRKLLPRKEEWEGISVRRIWRPPLLQHRSRGRMINAIFMLIGWTLRAIWMKRQPGEVMIVGSDPVLSVLAAIPWKILRPKSRIVHWCHDLYPDAAVADGMVGEKSKLLRLLNWMTGVAYRRCDLVADLGPCMRKRIQLGNPHLEKVPFSTLTPWALVEPREVPPKDSMEREELFGFTEGLGLLYSGNLGRAHDHRALVELAREMRNDPVSFCFAGRGTGIGALEEMCDSDDLNIRFAGFADESRLATRLSAADVHLVSLRSHWTGTVVPSKFFGAIAAGRPVLFAGDPDAAVACWIREFQLGWVLAGTNSGEIAESLRQYVRDPGAVAAMQQRCVEVYAREFSREVQLGKWLEVLGGLR